MATHLLAPGVPLTLSTLSDLLASGETVALAPRAAGFVPAGGPAPAAELAALRAQACGTGPEAPPPLVRLMLLLAAQQAVIRPSGLALSTAERLLALYNRELLPVVFQQGGDAVALAHLALPLLGEGEVNYQGYRLAAADALSLFSWAPLALRGGEAAALRRGAPFARAYAVDALRRARHLAQAAAAVSSEPADNAATAAARATLAAVAQAVEAAINGPGATPLAPVLGQLAAAVAALGQASAGRAGRVSVSPAAGAAGTLAAHGLVISRFAGAATDAYAALHAHQLVENTEQLLGLELLATAQAPESGRAGPGPEWLAAFRAAVPATGPEQAPYPALRQAAAFVRHHPWAAT